MILLAKLLSNKPPTESNGKFTTFWSGQSKVLKWMQGRTPPSVLLVMSVSQLITGGSAYEYAVSKVVYLILEPVNQIK